MWNIGSWCWWPGLSVRQHYKITMMMCTLMSVHCHESVCVRDMTLNDARTESNNKQAVSAQFEVPSVSTQFLRVLSLHTFTQLLHKA